MSFILYRRAKGVELDLSIKVDINKEIVICHVTNKKLIECGCVFLLQINFSLNKKVNLWSRTVLIKRTFNQQWNFAWLH